MSEWRESVEVKEKRKKISALGVRNAASKVLGVISIISTLIALSITISFNDGLLDDGSGWPFGFFLFVFPSVFWASESSGFFNGHITIPNLLIHYLFLATG